MSEKKCVCGHELESRGYQVLELHGESLLKDCLLYTSPSPRDA